MYLYTRVCPTIDFVYWFKKSTRFKPLMSAIQKNIGIFADCNSGKIGVAGTFLTFKNDEDISRFWLAYPNKLQGGSGTVYLQPHNITIKDGLYRYTNSNNMTSHFRINGTIVLDTIYSSYLPICGYTNQCNHSPEFNASTTKYTIKHFSNNITAYRYNVDGQYYKIRQSLASDSVLGSWYQFTATPNDFIVVEDEVSLNQYHLSVVHGGFYDFNEFAPCMNQLPNIRNLALEQIQVVSSSVAVSSTSTVHSTVCTSVTASTGALSTVQNMQTSQIVPLESFYSSLSDYSTYTTNSISKRTRLAKSSSLYDSYSIDYTTVATVKIM